MYYILMSGPIVDIIRAWYTNLFETHSACDGEVLGKVLIFVNVVQNFLFFFTVYKAYSMSLMALHYVMNLVLELEDQ